MASKRQNMLEYLKTLLATITTGNGYNFTVATVERGIRNIREMGDDQLPALFITMTHEKRKRRTQNQYSGDLQVLIVGYVKNTKGDLNGTATGVELDLDKLIEDVTKAIETDPLQKDNSGNMRVYNTEITDVATDDGDLQQVSGMVMSVVFSYVTEGTNP